MNIVKIKREIIELGKFLFKRGYIIANDGNLSVRLSKQEMLITARNVNKGELKSRDLIKLSLNEQIKDLRELKIKPSTEYRLHLGIYQKRNDINAIIHAHPLYSTIYAVLGKKLDVNLLTETAMTLGAIGYVKNYPPGSLELATAVAQSAINSNVILLAKHGVVVIGQNLREARDRLERLEFLAKISFLLSVFRD
ncbi:MAG: class II aldolase/adducin family protein [candidate division WOR-3 bacterium]